MSHVLNDFLSTRLHLLLIAPVHSQGLPGDNGTDGKVGETGLKGLPGEMVC